MGFRLNIKWGGLSVQSPLSTSSSSLPSSYSCRGRDSSYILARVSAASVLYSEAETQNDTSRAQVSSSSHQLFEKYFLETRELKVAVGKGSADGLYRLLGNDTQSSNDKEKSASVISSLGMQASQYRLLMKNLDMLEYMFADSDVVRLERAILEHLQRLGALRLFDSFLLSRTLKSSSSFRLSSAPTENVDKPRLNDSTENHVGKEVIKSGKKELRKSIRKRSMEKESDTLQEDHSHSPPRRSLRSRNKKLKVARNEAEMSSGVKMVAELEKLRTRLENDGGEMPSLCSWAEAAGVEKKELQRRLNYGWHCRDELLTSTCSLVLFIARNYWGLGVAFEDLIQAGKVGVLQGAERFDQTRGYKFSTYVQYWVRKSMSTLVARHSRGIRIPSTLSKAVNQVHKARKALRRSNGTYPDDCEIAKFTGLSVAKIISASKCLRVVGSIDQKIGDFNTKYMVRAIALSLPKTGPISRFCITGSSEKKNREMNRHGSGSIHFPVFRMSPLHRILPLCPVRRDFSDEPILSESCHRDFYDPRFSTFLQEIIPDTSTATPEEAVFRQHMMKDVYTLLDGLDSREREVIILRFGLGNCQCKSLEEIGKRFSVSKEWIRRIERNALTKMRNLSKF